MPQIKLTKESTDFYKEINKANEIEKNVTQVLVDYIINTRGIDQYETLKRARQNWGKELDLLENLQLNDLLILAIIKLNYFFI